MCVILAMFSIMMDILAQVRPRYLRINRMTKPLYFYTLAYKRPGVYLLQAMLKRRSGGWHDSRLCTSSYDRGQSRSRLKIVPDFYFYD